MYSIISRKNTTYLNHILTPLLVPLSPPHHLPPPSFESSQPFPLAPELNPVRADHICGCGTASWGMSTLLADINCQDLLLCWRR